MTITLPDAMRAEVEAKARAAGFPAVEPYIAYLVAADSPDEDAPGLDHGGPPEITFQTREELGRLLDEGANSGPGVIADAAFWAERRRVLRERLARRQGKTP